MTNKKLIKKQSYLVPNVCAHFMCCYKINYWNWKKNILKNCCVCSSPVNFLSLFYIIHGRCMTNFLFLGKHESKEFGNRWCGLPHTRKCNCDTIMLCLYIILKYKYNKIMCNFTAIKVAAVSTRTRIYSILSYRN